MRHTMLLPALAFFSALLAALFALSLSPPLAAHAQLLPAILQTPSYTSTTTASATPFVVANTSSLTPIAASTASNNVFPLGFNFSFFGNTYTSVTVHTDGIVQFRTSIATVVPPSAMPSPFPSTLLPALSFFHTDTTIDAAVTTASYGTMPNPTTPSTRVFLYRLVRARYASLPATTSTISLDLLLYETSNLIEIRYYALGASPATQPVLVGVMGGPWLYANNTADYTTILNAQPLTGSALLALNSTTVQFSPSTASTAAPAVMLGSPSIAYTPAPTYTLTALTNSSLPSPVSPTAFGASTAILSNSIAMAIVPLGFSFTFCSQPYRFVYISNSGYLQFSATGKPSSVTSPVTSITSFNAPAASLAPAFFPLLGAYWPTSDNERSYLRVGTAWPDRSFIVRFYQMRQARWTMLSAPETVSFFVTLYERNSTIRVDYYNVDVTVSTLVTIAAGVQCRSTPLPDWTYDTAVLVPATSTGITPALSSLFTNRAYVYAPTVPVGLPLPDVNTSADITTVPYFVQYASGSYTTYPLVYTAATFTPTETLVLPADGTPQLVNIGFSVVVFNDRYSFAYVSLFGYMRFEHYAPYPSAPFPPMSDPLPLSFPLGEGDSPAIARTALPLIAFAYGSWTATNTTLVQIQRGGVFTSSTRTFLLRFTNLAYSADPTRSMTVQVLFTEATNVIDISFVRVDSGVDTPIIVAAQGLPLRFPVPAEMSFSRDVGVYTRNYIVQLAGASLAQYGSLLDSTTIRLQPVFTPTPRAPLTYTRRSYAGTLIASPTAADRAPIMADVPSSSSMWTVVMNGSQALAGAPYGTLVNTSAPVRVTRVWVLPLGFTMYVGGQFYTTLVVQLDGGLLYLANSSFGATGDPNTPNSFAPTQPLPFVPLGLPFTWPVSMNSTANGVLPPFGSLMGVALSPIARSMIVFSTVGSAPDRRFLLRLESIAITGATAPIAGNTANVTVNVIMFESTGAITYSYDVMGAATGLALTIGLQVPRDSRQRFDLLSDWTVYSYATSTSIAGLYPKRIMSFVWQSDHTWNSTTTTLNLGVPTLPSPLGNVLMASVVDEDSQAVAFQMRFVGASREALAMAYGASFGFRLREAFAAALGNVPVLAVRLLDVQMVDARETAAVGPSSVNVTDTRIANTTMTVSVAVLPSLSNGFDAVSAVLSLLGDPVLALSQQQSNVFNGYGGGSRAPLLAVQDVVSLATGVPLPVGSSGGSGSATGLSSSSSSSPNNYVAVWCSSTGRQGLLNACPVFAVESTSSVIKSTNVIVGSSVGAAAFFVLLLALGVYWLKVRKPMVEAPLEPMSAAEANGGGGGPSSATVGVETTSVGKSMWVVSEPESAAVPLSTGTASTPSGAALGAAALASAGGGGGGGGNGDGGSVGSIHRAARSGGSSSQQSPTSKPRSTGIVVGS